MPQPLTTAPSSAIIESSESRAPSIPDLDTRFRSVSVGIAVKACFWPLRNEVDRSNTVTHTIFISYTTQGYDLHAACRLEIFFSAQQALLRGVCCAKDWPSCAQRRTSPMARRRGLVFSRELCTPIPSNELAETEACDVLGRLRMGTSLIGDKFVALILCNEYGIMDEHSQCAVSRSWEYGTEGTLGTLKYMSFCTELVGDRAVLTHDMTAKANSFLYFKIC